VTAEEIVQIRRQVIGLVRVARSGVAALQTRVESIWGDVRLTEQAKRVDISTALGEGRVAIEGLLEDEAVGALNRGVAQVERAIGRLKDVPADELSTTELALRPVLDAACREPVRLLNLYRQRHLRRADRLLIEQSTEAMIDALGDTDNYELRDSWRALQDELALARSDEEREALGYRDSLEELGAYLENARTVVEADLALLKLDLSQAERESLVVPRARAEAAINEFESGHAWVF
jgi:hypothetical protein